MTNSGILTSPIAQRQIIRLRSNKIKVLNNYVLIKPFQNNINRKTGSGIFLVSPEYSMQPYHIDRIGEVVAVPDKLIFDDRQAWITAKTQRTFFDKSKNVNIAKYTYVEKYIYTNEAGSLEWDTDLELKVGDTVLFSYMEAINCPMVVINNERYYLVNYSDIVARKRKGAIKPINGYLICETVHKEKISELDVISETQVDDRYLKVAYLSQPVRKYFGGKEEMWHNIKVGDKLLKEDPRLAPMTESLLHSGFFGEKKEYVFLQRRYISAILN